MKFFHKNEDNGNCPSCIYKCPENLCTHEDENSEVDRVKGYVPPKSRYVVRSKNGDCEHYKYNQNKTLTEFGFLSIAIPVVIIVFGSIILTAS